MDKQGLREKIEQIILGSLRAVVGSELGEGSLGRIARIVARDILREIQEAGNKSGGER